MTSPHGQLQNTQPEAHPVMAYIASIWPNFASGKTPQQKRQMIAAWETTLSDVPVQLQKSAIDAKAQAGQKWPPSSPAELLEWCDAIRKPMNGFDVLWYRQCAEDGILNPDFCRRQIEKYEAAQSAGRRAYAWYD